MVVHVRRRITLFLQSWQENEEINSINYENEILLGNSYAGDIESSDSLSVTCREKRQTGRSITEMV